MNSSVFFKKSASNWSVRAKFVFKSWAKTMLSFWWLCSFFEKDLPQRRPSGWPVQNYRERLRKSAASSRD